MIYEELMQNKDYKEYESKFCKEEKEILALLSDDLGSGGAKIYESWDVSVYFLAYIDLGTNELKAGKGRISWLLSDEVEREKGCDYPYYFEGGQIYKLKVRELKDKSVPDGMLESAFNEFMVVEILQKDIKEDRLEAIIREYRKPVKIFDDDLGELELNKGLSLFEGYIEWQGNKVCIFLDVDMEDKQSWQIALNTLKSLYKEQVKKDKEFREFAAKELTELANDWADEGVVIAQKEFEERISLEELSVDCEGNFTAYYNDDDMFYGHIIMIEGSLENGLGSADIAG